LNSSHISSARGNNTSLVCKKGARGVVAVSVLAMNSAEGAQLSSSSSSTLRGPCASFEGTLSSPSAVRGETGLSWVKGEVLGHGTLGTVYKALDQRTGKTFAVKEVRIDGRLESDLKYKTDLENEVSIYKELSHPHIVGYLGHDYLDNNLYIYLEYMAGGSVAQVLSQFGPLDESLIATYSRELLEGLEYLHTQKPVVLHRDVKGANILVGLDCKVKLSDFGCSKRAADTMSQSLRGSIPWMAPEVIKQDGHGRRSDIWSLGCVVIEMATARNPWGSFDNPVAAMMRIGMSKESPPVPDHLSEVCQDFIRQSTQRDRGLRPNASQLLKHEFVINDVLMSTIPAA